MICGGSCGSSCRSSDQVTRCRSLQGMRCRVDRQTVHQNKIWLSLESCHCHCQKREKPLLKWHMSCLCRCSQQYPKSMHCTVNPPGLRLDLTIMKVSDGRSASLPTHLTWCSSTSWQALQSIWLEIVLVPGARPHCAPVPALHHTAMEVS